MTFLFAAWLVMQAAAPIPIGKGVVPPKIIKRVEPTYNDGARADNVQGTVLLDVVVDESGHVKDIQVVNPIGYGLDEAAIAAAEKWEFRPATKNGQPVPVYAEIETTFRLLDLYYDAKEEARRSAYNGAIRILTRQSDAIARPGEEPAKAVAEMEKLAKSKYPPALFAMAMFYREGKHVDKDPAKSLQFLEESAGKHYRQAMYELGQMKFLGDRVPQDVKNGLDMIQESARAGLVNAQVFLATRYDEGKGVPQNAGHARAFFKLCASAGRATCQYRLGRMLLEDTPDDLVAIAWVNLAAQQGLAEAKEAVIAANATLTDQQKTRVATLVKQLSRPPSGTQQ